MRQRSGVSKAQNPDSWLIMPIVVRCGKPRCTAERQRAAQDTPRVSTCRRHWRLLTSHQRAALPSVAKCCMRASKVPAAIGDNSFFAAVIEEKKMKAAIYQVPGGPHSVEEVTIDHPKGTEVRFNGLTVIRFAKRASLAVDVRGGGPGTVQRTAGPRFALERTASQHGGSLSALQIWEHENDRDSYASGRRGCIARRNFRDGSSNRHVLRRSVAAVLSPKMRELKSDWVPEPSAGAPV